MIHLKQKSVKPFLKQEQTLVIKKPVLPSLVKIMQALINQRYLVPCEPLATSPKEELTAAQITAVS